MFVRVLSLDAARAATTEEDMDVDGGRPPAQFHFYGCSPFPFRANDQASLSPFLFSDYFIFHSLSLSVCCQAQATHTHATPLSPPIQPFAPPSLKSASPSQPPSSPSPISFLALNLTMAFPSHLRSPTSMLRLGGNILRSGAS